MTAESAKPAAGHPALGLSYAPDREDAAPPAFQILITSQPVSPKSFSPALQLNQQSLRLAYPGHRYQLFSNEKIRALLADDFEPDVLAAYDALRPSAFRADLARYCLLYRFGGLYSDLSYLHVQPLALAPDQELVLFRDVASFHPPHAVSNALILARPGHSLMERAIRQIVAHHKTGFLGEHPLDPTGPYMLGRLLQSHPTDASVVVGTSMLINQDRQKRNNIVKLLPDGTLIALRNKGRDSSIRELVAEGGNDYGRLWRKAAVWDAVPPAPPRRSIVSRLLGWAHRRHG